MRAEAAVAGTVADLPAVPLAEVVARADLQTRHDRKYLVPVPAYVEFVRRSADGLTVLDIDGRRSFRYESTYFDTPDLLTFRQHRQGRRRRYKVRTRTYLDTRECLLEVKLEGHRETTVKRRTPYLFADRGRLSAAARTFVADRLHRAYGGSPPPLVSMLSTSYRRTTLVDRSGITRITCDTGMVCADARQAVAASDRYVLVEVKSAHTDGFVDHLLWSLGVRPTKISKYCLAVAALHPGVSANPWYPALRTYFPGPGLGTVCDAPSSRTAGWSRPTAPRHFPTVDSAGTSG